jgi:hypothetical protein
MIIKNMRRALFGSRASRLFVGYHSTVIEDHPMAMAWHVTEVTQPVIEQWNASQQATYLHIPFFSHAVLCSISSSPSIYSQRTAADTLEGADIAFAAAGCCMQQVRT